MEDNEFWIRHLLGLLLQVGSTIYVILLSLPHNKLWLPTLLVLIAGIIKYAERNLAFYLASFDHFGIKWASVSNPKLPSIPVQFHHPRLIMLLDDFPKQEARSIIATATCTFGFIKSILVGPPMTKAEQGRFDHYMEIKDPHEMLRIIEIQLSLLYELLHTKLPVVDSKIGYVCRIVNFGCIMGALVSFSLLKKHYYKLGEFDIWLTYGLLIGALALDLISIWLLISSDWIMISRYSDKRNCDEFIDRHRWSNSIPQLNVFACHFKNKDGDYLDFLGIRSLFETIRRIQCVSSKDFVEGRVWNCIFTTLQEKYNAGQIHSSKGMFRPAGIFSNQFLVYFAWTLDKFDHEESLLIWHIATEICYQKGCLDNSPSSSASPSNNSFDLQEISKLLSDYMFYLLVMQPTMTATSPNNLKTVFEVIDRKWKWPFIINAEKGSKETFVKDLDKLLVLKEEDHELLEKLKADVGLFTFEQNLQINGVSRVTAACYLAKGLLNFGSGCPWELIGRFWVEMVCYTANNCQPIVHARQVSRGGQLLTLVWLLMKYLEAKATLYR